MIELKKIAQLALYIVYIVHIYFSIPCQIMMVYWEWKYNNNHSLIQSTCH